MSARAGRSAYRVFVRNLPWTVSKNELKSYFSQFGHVSASSVVFNKETGMSKQYGFVSFSTKDGMLKATNQRSHFIEGEMVTVDMSNRTPMAEIKELDG